MAVGSEISSQGQVEGSLFDFISEVFPGSILQAFKSKISSQFLGLGLD